ncbi:MAG: hypothetical protein HFG39_12170 [Lachnospiraceae bacterium]|nr:hypothetical protein [Lachnospiraceae bacterium]
MYYLVDTNVFLHAIRDNIFAVADLCKKNGTDVTITDTILSELEPGYHLEGEDKTAKDTYNSVYNLSYGTMGIKVIRIVNVDDIPGAKEELKRIRKRFYSWMTDITYLKHLVSQGAISLDDIKKKNFRKKDLGECELIAIAKAAENVYEIVTNDKGRVFLHPEQNLFDDYAVGIGLTVLNSDEWLNTIGCRGKTI